MGTPGAGKGVDNGRRGVACVWAVGGDVVVEEVSGVVVICVATAGALDLDSVVASALSRG